MRKGTSGALVVGILVACASGAGAQSQSCMYEGRQYGEGTEVCQAGLLQTCMNGEWQSLDGSRCGDDEDQAVEGEEGFELNPQGGFEED